MTIAVNNAVAVQAANPAALRAQASAGLTAASVASCVEQNGQVAVYSFFPASTATDTGDATPGVRKPNDIGAGSPGRWLISDWPDTSATNGTYRMFIFPVVINASGPSVETIAAGWALAGVTEVGGVRTAYFYKIII